ncbi:MAG: biopolymer transporter ExbD [Candidatus Omnitrophota bacterium]
MRFGSSRHKLMEGRYLDVAPVAGCVLLLMIFLMLTWNNSVQTQAGIGVDLPKAVTSETVKGKSSVITVTREKVLYFGKDAVSTAELSERLSSMDKKDSVLIKADKGTSLERVVEVWDICRRSGIRQVNIATTQAN